PRQAQLLFVEGAHDLGDRLDAEEGGEDQFQPALDFAVGMLDDLPRGLANQAGGQVQGQFAALGLAEQPRRQAGANRVQLQLRDQALQAEDKAPIDRGRVVDAVLVADQAAAVAAQVEELIPVGAVAGQAGDVVGDDDPDLFEGDEGDQFLEPGPPL